MKITAAQITATTAVVAELINAGIAIEGAAASAIKTIIGLFDPTQTPEEIAAGFAAVLEQDEVIAATAAKQSGGGPA